MLCWKPEILYDSRFWGNQVFCVRTYVSLAGGWAVFNAIVRYWVSRPLCCACFCPPSWFWGFVLCCSSEKADVWKLLPWESTVVRLESWCGGRCGKGEEYCIVRVSFSVLVEPGLRCGFHNHFCFSSRNIACSFLPLPAIPCPGSNSLNPSSWSSISC